MTTNQNDNKNGKEIGIEKPNAFDGTRKNVKEFLQAPVYATIIYEIWSTAIQADISTGQTTHQPKFSHMLV